MKATELRIGNYLCLFSKIVKVLEISNNEIKVATETKTGFIIEKTPLNSLSLDPIPLTEEWLLKLGFERIDYRLVKNIEKHKYDADYFYLGLDKVIRLQVLGKRNTSLYFPKIKYIHQLQNLYFSLTGKELTLK